MEQTTNQSASSTISDIQQKPAISTRQNILLVILLIVIIFAGIWYLFVWPSTKKLDSINEKVGYSDRTNTDTTQPIYNDEDMKQLDAAVQVDNESDLQKIDAEF